MPAANAASEELELSSGQSEYPFWGLSTSYHMRPWMLGNWVGIALSMSVIHCALEPPVSVEPTSATISGLLGAMDPVIAA
jgi:hypothetical protein